MTSSRRQFLRRSAGAAALLSVFTQSNVGFAAPSSISRSQPIRIDDFADAGLEGAITRGPKDLPRGTSHVGIHWRGEARRLAQVEVRVEASGRWSSWQALGVEHDPFDSDETFSNLVDVRDAQRLQYRVVVPGGRRLDRVVVTAISADRAAPAKGATPPPPATSASFRTVDNRTRPVSSRADWGCDESLGNGKSGNPIWPSMFVSAQKVVVHHTATSNTYNDGAAEVRAIHAYHARTLGWGDIGYTALIDRFGNVYEGRKGRPGETISAGVVAGHCLRHNYGSAGLAVLGDFTKRTISAKTANDQAMLAALEDLVVYECGRHGLGPDASSDFLKSDDAWHLAMATISGHKDSDATACPGAPLMNQLATLRTNSRQRLAPYVTATVALVGPTAPSQAASLPLSFSWSGAARYAYRLEGWYRVNADDVAYWGGSGWSTSEVTGWTDTTSGSATFDGLQPGHFTMHVRGYDVAGRLSALEAQRTVLLT